MKRASRSGLPLECRHHSARRCPFAKAVVGLPEEVRAFYTYVLRQTCMESREMSLLERRLLAREVLLEVAWDVKDERLVGLTRVVDLMVRHGRHRRSRSTGGRQPASTGWSPGAPLRPPPCSEAD